MAGIVVPLNSVYGHWSTGWGSDYDELREASSAGWLQGAYISGLQVYSGGSYSLSRGLVDFDMSDVSPSLEIAVAKIVIPDAVWQLNLGTVYYEIVDATGVTAGDSGYGEMFDKITVLGSILIPVTAGASYHGAKEIEFNATGLTFLESKAGGIARLGARLDEEIAGNPPGAGITQRFGINPYYPNPGEGVPYILLNYLPTARYYIWVEGTNFAYVDHNKQKRLKEGTLTGDPDGDPNQAWVYGDYQYYTDYLGKVRRILGTLTGLTGKVPYQVSINTKSPMLGTHYCYIDSSGNERCFEGSIP